MSWALASMLFNIPNPVPNNSVISHGMHQDCFRECPYKHANQPVWTVLKKVADFELISEISMCNASSTLFRDQLGLKRTHYCPMFSIK